jgi:enamine deaminase RidA (YjgF/YER057c/UK114 family)
MKNTRSQASQGVSDIDKGVRGTISAFYANRLAKLGLELPPMGASAGSYLGYSISGCSIHVSGQVPVCQGKVGHVGQVGREVSIDDAQAAARLCALNVLAQLAHSCSYNFDAVRRCVRVGVFVNAQHGFSQHPIVANGASELILEVFGDRGRHARAVVGVASLPFGVPVEVEALFEIDLAAVGAVRSGVLL